MQFARQSLGSFLVLLLGIVSSVLLARLLGPEGRGEYALAVKVAGLVLAVAQWGIAEVLLQVLGEGRFDRGTVVGTTLLLVGAACAVGAGVVYAALPLLATSVLKNVDPALVGIALAGSVLSILGLLARRFIQLDGRLYVYSGLDALRTVVFLAIAVALVTTRQAYAMGAVVAWALAEAILAAASVGYLWLKVARSWSFEGSVAGSLLRAGVPLQFGLLATYVGNEAGLFVLNATFTLASVGVYAVASSVARLVLNLATVLRTVLQPRLVQPGQDPAAVTAQVTRHGLLGMLVVSVGLAVGSPLMPVVFGAQFGAAPPVLVLMLPGMVAYGVMQLLAGYLLRIGHRRTLALSSLVLAVVSVSLQAAGAHYAGAEGAALGLTIAYVASAAVVVNAFVRATGGSLADVLPRPADLAVYADLLRLRGRQAVRRPIG